MSRIGWKRMLLALVGATGVLAGSFVGAIEPSQPTTAKAEPAAAPRNGSEVELIVMGKNKLARVQVQIEIAGRPATRVWGETFDWLMARTDRNDDGRLNAEEAASLPSPFHLRQLLWGRSMPYSGLGPKLETLDTDQDGKVDRGELADFYAQTGLGSAVVAIGKAPLTDALTETLTKRLDLNGDQDVSEAEWRTAHETLRKLDSNDDEMIGPGELLAKASYPGVLASLLVTPAKYAQPADGSEATARLPQPDHLPLMMLPRRRQNVAWTAELIRRRDVDGDGKLDLRESGLADAFSKLDEDKDGKLNSVELAAWRTLPAEHRWSIRLGKDGKPIADGTGKDAFVAEAGGTRLELRAEGGRLNDEADSIRKRVLGQFAEADTDRDGFLVAEETKGRNSSELRALLEREDRDGDQKLSEKEVNAWADFQAQIASGHVMISVLDFGSGLFEFLDADHNSGLSGRELRTAWERLKSSGAVVEGRFDRTRLPLNLIGEISHGRALEDRSNHRAGPTWFVSMDRNADGELSAREFLGPPADFRKMDRDSDGSVSAEEAATAPQGRADQTQK